MGEHPNRRGWITALLIAGLGVSALTPTARASGRPELGVAFGTAAPFFVGGEGSLGVGPHFSTHFTLGWMPGTYVDLVNEVSVAKQWYDQDTADLIASALESTLLLGGHLTYKPFRRRGLEVRAGYTLAALDGASTTGEVVEAVRGQTIPPIAWRDVRIDSQLHLLEIGAGWGWRIRRHAYLHASVSMLECFDSTTRSDIVTAFAREEADARNLEAELNDYLDGIFTDYITTPLLRVMLGSRF